jgi:hypothetical protein
VTRQTTLFGLPPRTQPDEPKRNAKKKNATQEGEQGTAITSDSQATNATIVDIPDLETQIVDGDTQPMDEETQITEDTSLTDAQVEIDSQVGHEPRNTEKDALRDSEEPMEWPASPGPSTTNLKD